MDLKAKLKIVKIFMVDCFLASNLALGAIFGQILANFLHFWLRFNTFKHKLYIIVGMCLKQLINAFILSHYRSLYIDYDGYSGHLSLILSKNTP